MLDKLRKKLKKNSFILRAYEVLFQRPIADLYKVGCSKKVLFSYSTYHFNKGEYVAHSNNQESHVIARVFHELGYRVDVINNNREFKGRFDDYDIVFGEGMPMFQALQSDSQSVIIYYGTGSHPWHCSRSSLKRLIEFNQLNNFLALNSTRISDDKWGIAASAADAVICIGNEQTKQTFLEFGSSNVYPLDPTFHQRHDSQSILSNKCFSVSRKTALWFGSYGLLHKGLDLAVEAFRSKPDWTLHVCGYLEAESDFIKELNIPDNVKINGFLDVYSEQFRQLANGCAFTLLPSCSEGTSTAVLTTVGNGGMIPIVTKESGVDINDFGFLVEQSQESILDALSEIDSKTDLELKSMANLAYKEVSTRYTLDHFELSIKKSIEGILNGK